MTSQFPGAFFFPPWPVRRESLGLSGGERWYLVHALARQECRAEFQLSAQDYRVFLPSFARTVRHARKLRVGPSPGLFRLSFRHS